MLAQEYLRRILKARVYDVAEETPLDYATQLSARLQNRVFLKREDLQPSFSFKIRGAYNRMVRLSKEEREKGVITVSGGNHAQGVALAAARLHCRTVVFMPITAPRVKVEAVKRLGGEYVETIQKGRNVNEAGDYAARMQRERGLVFIHPSNDPEVIAGHGTIAMEILRQYQPSDGSQIDAVFCAVGGGGLISGIATYIKALYPGIQVIGVQTKDSCAMKQSLDAGHPVEIPRVGNFSDGTAVKKVGDEPFRICSAYVDDIVLVDADEVCAAIKDIFDDTRSIVEPAGALGVAGAKAWARRNGVRGRTLVAINSGANINFERLRYVAARAEIGEEHEAVFAVTIPEETGSFRKYCRLVGNRAVTEFNYRISDRKAAHVLVGIQTKSPRDAEDLERIFRKAGLPCVNLTHDDLTQLHVRHMVGGKNPLAVNERLFRFTFPEYPGALLQFLTALSPDWNISLFHYRNNGGDHASVLCGLQVPGKEKKRFQEFLDSCGYPYEEETDSPAYRTFLYTESPESGEAGK